MIKKSIFMAMELELHEAAQADELFIAVTTRDIVPVVVFDGVKIGSGVVGEVTKTLMAKFLELTDHD